MASITDKGMQASPDDKKQIACTRSFGQPVRERHHLQEVIAAFTKAERGK